jgi:hypothetical protein
LLLLQIPSATVGAAFGKNAAGTDKREKWRGRNDAMPIRHQTERLPVDNAETIRGMLAHADLTVTARTDAGLLGGVSRAISDFSYCTYLSMCGLQSSTDQMLTNTMTKPRMASTRTIGSDGGP